MTMTTARATEGMNMTKHIEEAREMMTMAHAAIVARAEAETERAFAVARLDTARARVQGATCGADARDVARLSIARAEVEAWSDACGRLTSDARDAATRALRAVLVADGSICDGPGSWGDAQDYYDENCGSLDLVEFVEARIAAYDAARAA